MAEPEQQSPQPPPPRPPGSFDPYFVWEAMDAVRTRYRPLTVPVMRDLRSADIELGAVASEAAGIEAEQFAHALSQRPDLEDVSAASAAGWSEATGMGAPAPGLSVFFNRALCVADTLRRKFPDEPVSRIALFCAIAMRAVELAATSAPPSADPATGA